MAQTLIADAGKSTGDHLRFHTGFIPKRAGSSSKKEVRSLVGEAL